jgi:hypothetical protein
MIRMILIDLVPQKSAKSLRGRSKSQLECSHPSRKGCTHVAKVLGTNALFHYSR